MPDERIKVIFKRVEVRNNGDWVGAGEWYFRASVDGQELEREGRPTTSVRDNQPINLRQDFWFKIVDVTDRNKTEVPIVFEAWDKDVTFNDAMGTFRYTLEKHGAWQQTGDLREPLENYTLVWEVQLEVGGVFDRHPASSVFATRRHTAGGVNFSTVTGVRRASRLEICPVWPVPPDASLPTRPPPGGVTVIRNGTAKAVVAGSDPNIIPNPAVIPLLSAPAPAAGPAAALPAGAPPRATAQTAARIEATYYYPNTLAFTDNDPRLEWEAVPAARADFLGGNHGLKVMVYGKQEGDVVLRVSFQGSLFAEYRAVVGAIRQVPFRVNILNHGGSSPQCGPQDAENHIAIANRFLRQAGIELVPDTNTTLTNGATTTGHDGIYRINSVGLNRTRNVAGSHPMSCRLNHRSNVLNVQYVHSIQDDPGWTTFGWALDRPAHPNHPSVTDSLVPTPSWMPVGGGGCGVPPDGAPVGAASILLLEPSNRAGFPNLAAVLISNACGDPTTDAGARMYGNVIAHEVGHVLGLRHRVGNWDDGSGGHPPQQNVMCQGEPPMTRQDFDRFQSEAMRAHPLAPP